MASVGAGSSLEELRRDPVNEDSDDSAAEMEFVEPPPGSIEAITPATSRKIR
jgi:hypothetical protein